MKSQMGVLFLLLSLSSLVGCAGKVATESDDDDASTPNTCAPATTEQINACEYLCRINVPLHHRYNPDATDTIEGCIDGCACVSTNDVAKADQQ